MTPRDLLLSEWSTVERVIAFTCHKKGLRGPDAEDFASVVAVRLFENDCEIVAKFRHDSALSTYLTTVVMHIYVDEYVKKRGKWRASAKAERIGPHAVELEKQVMRDRHPIVEVTERLKISIAEAEAILDSLPQRDPRRDPVPLEPAIAETLRSSDDADTLTVDRERWNIAKKTEAVLRAEISRFGEEDRLILQLQLEQGMKISEIARALQTEQKPLYARLERLRSQLRDALKRNGITWKEVQEVLQRFPEDIDFGLRKAVSRPSQSEGSVAGDQPESSQ